MEIKIRSAVAPLLVLCLCVGLVTSASGPRRLLDSGWSTVTIYSNGLTSAWSSWSWGTQKLTLQDSGPVMSSSQYALCATLNAYGAVSLKSNTAFTLQGSMQMFVHSSTSGSGVNAGNNSFSLGDLELQFESSAPSSYTISRSYTLSELVNAQGWTNGKSPDTVLHNIETGGWEQVTIQMPQFAPNGTSTSAQYDRITMGSCLQRYQLCSGKTLPEIYVCLDKMSMTGPVVG